MASKKIYVYADWLGLNGPCIIGILRAESIRGNEVFSFEYDDNWLHSNQLFVLDPDLNYYSGPQYLQDDKPNFGVFLDSSPDRWGRVLMRRREALLARMENRPQKNLMQSDLPYLAFMMNIEWELCGLKSRWMDHFSMITEEMAAPPWTSLRELEYASLQLEKDDSVEDPRLSEMAEFVNRTRFVTWRCKA
jgi:serine/threonine-protein kinase HipA